MAAFAATLAAAPAPSDSAPAYIDLQPQANVKLKDGFLSGTYAGNNLAKLPTGKQTVGGVKVNVGESPVQLGDTDGGDKPRRSPHSSSA